MKPPLFIKSIRVRLLLWLAFLLACVLTGFGVTAYQLHRINLFESIDEELESRVAILARERSAGEYRETVETCLGAAQQMRRLTQSLLELARLDAGQERLECTQFDLSERLQACIQLVQPLATQRNIKIEANLSSIEAHGDPDRLCQVFTNLLTNAVRMPSSTPTGEPSRRSAIPALELPSPCVSPSDSTIHTL